MKYQDAGNGMFVPFSYNVVFNYSERTLLSELLNHFAKNKYPICNEHIRLDGCLHYIIRDNHVEWLVPSDKCTICEYLECFGDSIIELEMPTEIGGAVEVFKWILKLLDIVQKIDWVREKLKKTNFEELFKIFKSRDGRYIEQNDLKDFVISKHQWTLIDFMNLLGCNDDVLAESLLKYYGFEDVSHGLYVFNSSKMMENKNNYDTYDYQQEALIDKLLKDNHM